MDTAQISEIVRTTLEAKIIEAFKNTPEMIDELVQACLNKEVDTYGNKPDAWSKDKMPYLTHLAQHAVQQVAREAVNEYIETMTPNIKTQVKAKLSTGEMVDALTASIIESTKNPHDVKIEFKPKPAEY